MYNPKNRPEAELPTIFGFVNGSFGSDVVGQLLAEDGTPLGSHISSDIGWLQGDLGIREGSRPDRHETFRQHYPDGYKMEFVENVDANPRLLAAIKLANEEPKPSKGSDASIKLTLTE